MALLHWLVTLLQCTRRLLVLIPFHELKVTKLQRHPVGLQFVEVLLPHVGIHYYRR